MSYKLYDLPFEFKGQQLRFIVLIAIDFHKERCTFIGGASYERTGVITKRNTRCSMYHRIPARSFYKQKKKVYLLLIVNEFKLFSNLLTPIHKCIKY